MAAIVRRADFVGREREFMVNGPTADAKAIMLGPASIPPGGRVGRHYHPGIENAIYVVSGRVVAYVGPEREAVEVAAGDLIYIPADELHELYNPSSDEVMLGVRAYNNANIEDENHTVWVP